MSEVIYKYILSHSDEQTLSMPWGAEILSVQVQAGALCLWAKVDLARGHEDRTIYLYGTGQFIRESCNNSFIGTVQDGDLVWHVFERINKPEEETSDND